MSLPITDATHTITYASLSKTVKRNCIIDGGFLNKEILDYLDPPLGANMLQQNYWHHWLLVGGEAVIDPHVTYEGLPSLRLKATSDNSDALVYQRFSVDKDATSFKIKAAIKTRNLAADDTYKGVYFTVRYTSGNTQTYSSKPEQILRPTYDTEGWELVESSFTTNVGLKIDSILVEILLKDLSGQGALGDGYMWVSNLSLVESDDEAENETFNVSNDGDLCVVPEIIIQGKLKQFGSEFHWNMYTPEDVTIYSTNDYIAQSIMHAQPRISVVDVYVKKFGAPDDDLIVELVPMDSSDDPDESKVLARATIDKDSITTDYSTFQITLAFNCLVPFTKYAIMMRTDATNLSDPTIGYAWAWEVGSPGYKASEGKMYESSDGGSTWSDSGITNKDHIFTTHFPLLCGEPMKFYSYQYSKEDGTEIEFGKTTNYNKVAQTFKSDFNHRLHSVILKPYTHTGTWGTYDGINIIVTIQETEWDTSEERWKPNGVVLAKRIISQLEWEHRESTTFNEGDIIEIIFERGPLLLKNDRYAVVLEREDSLSDTKHPAVHGSDTSGDNYSDGEIWYWNGSSWNLLNANQDLCFFLRYIVDPRPIRIKNTSTGDTLELDGKLLPDAKIEIYRDGSGKYSHEYYNDTNWLEVIGTIDGDIRYPFGLEEHWSFYETAPHDQLRSDENKVSLVFEYDLIFPCSDQPYIKCKTDSHRDTFYYYSFDRQNWVRFHACKDENWEELIITLPFKGVSKFYIKIENTGTSGAHRIKEFYMYANLDCSLALTKLKLKAIGNNVLKPLFTGSNSEYTLDLNWTKVEGTTRGFAIGSDPEFGYEMWCHAVGPKTPFPHTHHRTIKGYGYKQRSKYQQLGRIPFDLSDVSSNFQDIAKIKEWINSQELVYVRNHDHFWQGVLSDLPYQIVGGVTTLRKMVFELDETRQIT